MTFPPNKHKLRRPWHRLNASAYVVLALTATVLFLLNVPGERRMECNSRPTDQTDAFNVLNRQIEHGWPWTYLVREQGFHDYDPLTGTSRPTSLWSFEEDFISRSPSALFGNVAIALLMLPAVAIIFERWRRRRARLWQPTVVDLLALTALIAVGTGYVVHAVRQHQVERDALLAAQIIVEGNSPWAVLAAYDCEYERAGPDWLRDLVGDRWPACFDRVAWAAVRPEHLDKIAALRSLRALSVDDARPDDARLAAISKLPRLELLVLHSAEKLNDPRTTTTVLDHMDKRSQIAAICIGAADCYFRIGSSYFKPIEDVFIGYPPYGDWNRFLAEINADADGPE